MTDIGAVLRELKAYGLLARATSIVADDVRVEMLAGTAEQEQSDHMREKLAEQEREETLFGSS